MSKRGHISLRVKLAAALLTMKRMNDAGQLVPIITYEESKRLTADQIIARFHFDHWPIRKADGGPDEPWNLEPRPIAEHQKKTDEIDKPQIAKQRRIRGETGNGAKRKIPSRVNAWPKRGSRPFKRAGGVTPMT